MKERVEDTSGTTIVGIRYDKGVLVLSDTQRSSYIKPTHGVEKITPVEKSILLAAAGTVVSIQEIKNAFRQAIRYYREGMENVIDEEFKEIRSKLEKKRYNLWEKVDALYKGEFFLSDEGEEMIIGKVPRNIDGDIEPETLSFPYQTVGKDIVIELKSAIELLRYVKTSYFANKDPEYAMDFGIENLIAGYDGNGPAIYVLGSDNAISEPQNYASIGSGCMHVISALELLYKEGFEPKGLEDTLKLGLVSGWLASTMDLATNDQFKARVIERSKRGIVSKRVSQRLVDRLTNKVKKGRLGLADRVLEKL